MKIKVTILSIFGVIVMFPVMYVFSIFASYLFAFCFHAPESTMVVILVLFIVALIDLVVYLIIKAIQSNKTRKVSVILCIFFLLDTVSYVLFFGIVPTPTFCHMVTPGAPFVQCDPPWGGCPSPPQQPPFMECGHSVLLPKNWKDKSFHIEWDKIPYNNPFLDK